VFVVFFVLHELHNLDWWILVFQSLHSVPVISILSNTLFFALRVRPIKPTIKFLGGVYLNAVGIHLGVEVIFKIRDSAAPLICSREHSQDHWRYLGIIDVMLLCGAHWIVLENEICGDLQRTLEAKGYLWHSNFVEFSIRVYWNDWTDRASFVLEWRLGINNITLGEPPKIRCIL